jgi:hypothetical protein
LGHYDPPTKIEVDGLSFGLVEVFKHDSWAATALYQSADRRIVCKFNRATPLWGIPMEWLGRRLARREAAHLQRLIQIDGVPQPCGEVFVEGRRLPYAVAHDFVEGRPLGKNEPVSEEFDQQLVALIESVHRQDMAYVDFHKRENVLVGNDGAPHLIDFQVSWMVRQDRPWWGFGGRWLLRRLQALDRYHVEMHLAHHQRLRGQQPISPQRPAWVKIHRLVSVPFRKTRRWLLVQLGIRQGAGNAASEHFPEKAFR